MDELIEKIRSAIATDADESTKAAGAEACRAILAVLEVKAGEPLVSAPPPSSPLAAVAAQLRGAPPGVVLDALIAKLRAHLPADERDSPKERGAVRIPFVPVPGPRKGSGDAG